MLWGRHKNKRANETLKVVNSRNWLVYSGVTTIIKPTSRMIIVVYRVHSLHWGWGGSDLQQSVEGQSTSCLCAGPSVSLTEAPVCDRRQNVFVGKASTQSGRKERQIGSEALPRPGPQLHAPTVVFTKQTRRRPPLFSAASRQKPRFCPHLWWSWMSIKANWDCLDL